MLRSRTEAPKDVREVLGGNIDVVTFDEGAIADVVLITAPEVTIGVIGSVDQVTVPSNTDDITEAIRGLVLPPLFDGKANRVRSARFKIFAHIRGYRSASISVSLVRTWRPHVVVIFREGCGVGQALVQRDPLVFYGVFVACRDCIEDIGARDGDS